MATKKKGDSLYLYCFTKTLTKPGELGGIGQPPATVQTLPYREIVALVSVVPQQRYYPTAENALAHQRVVTWALAQGGGVIPVKFGTLCPGLAALEKLCGQHYQALLALLATLQGKIELGLRVTWKKEVFQREIEAQDARIVQLKSSLLRNPRLGGYLGTLQLGELAEASAGKLRQDYVELIYRRLEAIAVQSRLNPFLGVRGVFTVAFLVTEEKESDFDRAVNDLYEQFSDRLLFHYSGPWPPYNFVDLHWESGGEEKPRYAAE